MVISGLRGRAGVMVAAVLALLAVSTPAPAATVPGGFTDVFLSDVILNDFTDIEFLPDGRTVVNERHGHLHIFDTNQAPSPRSDMLLFLENEIFLRSESGLLAMALDPNFTLGAVPNPQTAAANRWIYIYYTRDVGGTALPRIDRFTFDPSSGTTSSGTRQVIWTGDGSGSSVRYGGQMAFDNAGYLYLSTGDAGSAGNARDLTTSHGKIIRINKDGTIPGDNPYAGAIPGRDDVWASGFRNALDMHYDPVADRLYVTDRGTSVEEINVVTKGADYGWDGTCQGTGGCAAGTTAPVFSYAHTGGAGAITGGWVNRNPGFPNQGAYYYGDLNAGWIRYLTFNGAGTVTGDSAFATGANPDDIAIGPDGHLYYLEHVEADVRRIESDLPPNASPIIDEASATPTSGPLNLTVTFTGVARDPDGDDSALTYLWIFGDGATSTTASPSHTYTTGGIYQARLEVSDGASTTVSAPITIQAGDGPFPDSLWVGITASSDDAEDADPVLSSADLDLGEKTVGLRFPSVPIPANATIISASIQFTDDPNPAENGSGAGSIDIHAHAADNAGTFVDAADVTGRTRTSATVPWDLTGWPNDDAAGPGQRTPDLTPLIEEVIGRPGWAPGNALAFLFETNPAVWRVAESYDGNAAAAPMLHVEWVVDPGLVFVPVTACAVFDTRDVGPPLAAGETRSFDVVGGSTGCAEPVPAGAEAVFLNVVAVTPAGAGELMVAPAGEVAGGSVVPYQAFSPNMNNSNAVPVGLADGWVDVTADGALTEARGVVLGYWVHPAVEADGLVLSPVNPCAVFDTRVAEGGTGPLGPNAMRTFDVMDHGCGIPVEAEALLLNLVAVNPAGGGNLKIAAAGVPPEGGVVNYQAFTPNLNNSNAIVVPLNHSGVGGQVDVYTNGSGSEVRGVVLGYLAPQSVTPGGLLFYPTPSCQAFDDEGIPANSSRPFDLAAAGCNIPADADGVFLNLQAKGPLGGGNLKAAVQGVAPEGGVVNYQLGIDNANAIVLDGPLIDVYTNGSGSAVGGVTLGYFNASTT